jgi:hypothetical protein
VHELLAKSPDQRPASAAHARSRFQAILDAGDDCCDLDDEPTLHHHGSRPKLEVAGAQPSFVVHHHAVDHSRSRPRIVTARRHLMTAAVLLGLLVLAFAITLALRA